MKDFIEATLYGMIVLLMVVVVFVVLGLFAWFLTVAPVVVSALIIVVSVCWLTGLMCQSFDNL